MNRDSLINPLDLRDFLHTRGWTLRAEGLADRLYVLQNPGFPHRQLVFPMDTTIPDYAETVDRVIEKLSELINEPPQTVRGRIQTVRDDTVRFRIDAPDNGDGSLPLDFAAVLVTGAQQLLKAAACTVLRPRLHHPRLALTEALQLIEKSRFGQTEPGSFILKVSCPIHALDAQGTLPFTASDLPFVRQVTLALQRGLTQLIGAIETGALDRLVETVQQDAAPLISTNLCEAVMQLYDEALKNAVDISIDWSALEPIAEPDRQRQPLRIQRDYFPRIEEVRRALRPGGDHVQETFIGTVEHLAGEMGDDGRRTGEVILALLLPEGESVRARVALSAEQYRHAHEAHITAGAYVQVTGKLQSGRQPRALTELAQFARILPQTAQN